MHSPWFAPALWPGETAVCIASGPSLTQSDVGRCRNHRVIVVNDCWRLAPWADALVAADLGWWQAKGPSVGEFAGLRVTTDTKAGPDLLRLDRGAVHGVSSIRNSLATGRNSGSQAIGLAVHLGAARIVLLGYDLAFAPDGRRHWFGDHPDPLRNPAEDNLLDWRSAFNSMVAPLAERNIEIINASRETALTCFPRADLETALGR